MSISDYRELEVKLYKIRKRLGASSSEEDIILDEMDRVWYGLNDEERGLLNSEGPFQEPLELDT
ncbi:MAG: hypothetical protein ACXABY_00470 [Candidatus Thorarchaeota archaeon]